MQISNGAGGSVNLAGVDQRNRLLTYSTDRDEELSATYDGNSFSMFVDVTPAGAGDNFFFLGTGTSSVPVVVSLVKISSASAEDVDVLVGKFASPSVTGATTATPKNKNVANSKVCPWTSSVGTSISVSGTFEEIDTLHVDTFASNYLRVILQPGNCLILRSVTGGVALRGSVQFYLLEGTQTGTWVE